MASRKSSTATSREESLLKKKLRRKIDNAFSREGKSHGVVYDSFKVSGTDESVLDLNEIVKVELKNDNVLSSQYAMG